MNESKNYESMVGDHYKQQAQKMGLSKLSTMPDEIVRERELDAIIRYLGFFIARGLPVKRVLDIGCGNGYALSLLREKFPQVELTGIDYSADMVQLAKDRGIERCTVKVGDVRALDLESEAFDVVVSERCVINCMDINDQQKALKELSRVLRKGGMCLFIEGFTDALDNLNRARTEMGLEAVPMPYHNLFFDKEWFSQAIQGSFVVKRPADLGDPSLPDQNFLSSHYFISRVVHPSVTKGGDLRNSEFVKFFSYLPPMGNYAFVQFWVLEKI